MWRLLIYFSAISINLDVNLLYSLGFKILHHQSGELWVCKTGEQPVLAGPVSLQECWFPRARSCCRSLFLWSLPGALAPSQHRAVVATAPTRPGEMWNREALQCLLQFWELNRFVILLLMLLNIGSGQSHGAGALRWPVATSCAQHCHCQLQHCNTCCVLSSGWKAPKGPALASAQSLLQALCFRRCQVLAAPASFQHVVFGVTLGTDSSLLG